MTIISSSSPSSPEDISPWRLADTIFVSLMENGFDEISKSNRYIIQLIDKFRYFRIKSDKTFFEINFKDLNSETLDQITNYTKDFKRKDEKYARLDGVSTEVIARIAKQAEPAILSSYANERRLLTKVALNEIREIVSYRWKLVGGNENRE